MSDFTFPFKDVGGFPALADNFGSAFFITNNLGGNAIFGISPRRCASRRVIEFTCYPRNEQHDRLH
jgi:hypothetical protein